MPINRRTFVAGTAALGAASLIGSRPADAAILSVEEAMERRYIGSEDAPVNIMEFFSLGCPHCRAFHEETLPILKQEYIDTGKVRFEFRDYPLGIKATAAAMITRCAPANRYTGLVELMFRSQAQWAQVNDTLPPLKQVAKFGGLSGEDVDACLNKSDLLEAMRTRAESDSEEYDINSTPSFYIVESEQKIEGAQPVEAFRQAIDAILN